MCKLRGTLGFLGHDNKNNRFMNILLMLLFVCIFVLPAKADYGGGTGEPNDPYLIYTAEQMNEIGADPNDWDKHFKLMADIVLGRYPGTDFNIIGDKRSIAFSGVFDGNDHTISNFTYSSTVGNCSGIFGYIEGPEVEIRNLGIIDPNIDANLGMHVGSLAGYADNGTFTNCYVRGGSISGSRNVGGLIGNIDGGTITNCHTEGCNISGIKKIGGLVGYNDKAEIEDCHSACSVSGGDDVGGLVGHHRRGTIDNSYATGMVSADGENVGGLVGDSLNHITNCSASGDVLGSEKVGGLAGWQSSGTIANSHATGIVLADGNDVGGLVGNNSGHVTNCSAAGDVIGSRNVGGLVGSYGNHYGSITNSCSSGNITGEDNVGGLVGNCTGKTMTLVSDDDTITGCYTTGNVSGIQNVGGLLGINSPLIDGWGVYSRITYCYSTGSVSGIQNVGGLVGTNSPWLAYSLCISIIADCYSTGSVTGTTDVGGLVGWHKEGEINTSFWDIQTSGLSNMCGHQDQGTGCDDSKGKTTSEMQIENTYLNAGWDFVNESANGAEDIWIIREGQDYPKLISQFVTARIIDDFEDYNADDNPIWFSWHDGLGTGTPGTPGYLPGNETGSAVGDKTISSYTEETIVHGGNQSMPYSYNNSFKFSKAELLLSPAQDWTEESICMLSLWFHGVQYNAPASMSVVLNGDYTVYHDNPNITKIDTWTRWTIDLLEFTSLDLTNVNSIAICFGDHDNLQSGGSGTMFFDDIRLYRSGCR